jgi:uncharacterized protein (DUF433 family)
MDWREHIAVDPAVCHGQACVRGIPAAVVLDNLATGLGPAEIIKSYPALTPLALQTAVTYAAELTRDHVLPMH